MNSALKIRELCKYYQPSFPALWQVNLDLEPGKVVGLLGPNGSGKTTLIKLIMGLLTPNSGTIKVCGHPVGVESKKRVAYLPDRNFLPGNRTAKEMMDFYSDFFADFRRDRAEGMLKNLGVDPSQKIKTLSKGTQEKVSLVLTMSREADLYLLDEPIAGVDPATRDYILRTIVNNYSEHATVLISTHLIADVEPILSDVIFLKNGQIVRIGAADAIREETGMSIDALFREEFRYGYGNQ